MNVAETEKNKALRVPLGPFSIAGIFGSKAEIYR